MTGNKLKLIACVAMLFDHIAWAFLLLGGVGDILHLFGRITAPVMCYFIAEGFYHTYDVKRYGLRLFFFGAVSQFPYLLFERVPLNSFRPYNVIFSLLIGLFALYVWRRFPQVWVRIPVIVSLCFFSMVFSTDWQLFAVLWVLFFGVFHGRPKKQMIAFSIIALCAASYYGQWFQLGLFLAVPLLLRYNGERGSNGKVSKWGFYIFYPAHLLLIGLLR